VAERMIKGDPGAESVFLWTREKKGAAGSNTGGANTRGGTGQAGERGWSLLTPLLSPAGAKYGRGLTGNHHRRAGALGFRELTRGSHPYAETAFLAANDWTIGIR